MSAFGVKLGDIMSLLATVMPSFEVSPPPVPPVPPPVPARDMPSNPSPTNCPIIAPIGTLNANATTATSAASTRYCERIAQRPKPSESSTPLSCMRSLTREASTRQRITMPAANASTTSASTSASRLRSGSDTASASAVSWLTTYWPPDSSSSACTRAAMSAVRSGSVT